MVSTKRLAPREGVDVKGKPYNEHDGHVYVLQVNEARVLQLRVTMRLAVEGDWGSANNPAMWEVLVRDATVKLDMRI